LRENIPLAISATVILFSFGIIILFVTVSILEKKSSDEIELQHIENLIDNATVIAKETQKATKHELLQFFNKTSDAIRNSPELQQFRQQFENVTNSTG
jgi:hypothetical protein